MSRKCPGNVPEKGYKTASHGVKEAVIGQAHRGRNNILACMLDLPPVLMFRKMKGFSEFPSGTPGYRIVF